MVERRREEKNLAQLGLKVACGIKTTEIGKIENGLKILNYHP